MVQKKNLQETLELVRDILKLFGDFAHDAALIEKEHNININDLGELLKDIDVNALLIHPDTKFRQAVFPLFQITQIPELSEFLTIPASRKLDFAQKVYGISSQLEAELKLSHFVHPKIYVLGYLSLNSSGSATLGSCMCADSGVFYI